MVEGIHYGERSVAVSTLQRALIALGHDLPRWGADGTAGAETYAAYNEWARAVGLPEVADTEPIPMLALDILAAFARLKSIEPKPTFPAVPEWLKDYRGRDLDKHGKPRDWASITGVTLHQTGCLFLPDGASPAKVARELDRVSKIRAHFVGLRNGLVTFNAPLNVQMWHAQRVFNATDVGFEIDGHFAGVEGDLSTYWRPKGSTRLPIHPSEIQIIRAREVVKLIVETVAAHKGEVRFIHSHRQTHSGKPSDPGQEIWQGVGVWAQKELGLTDGGNDFYVPNTRDKRGGLYSDEGPGRPNPVEWDPNRVKAYKWRPKA